MISTTYSSFNQYIGRKFKSFLLAFLFLTTFVFIDIGSIDHGINGCMKNIFVEKNDTNLNNTTDVTFIAFGDTQHWDSTNYQNDLQVQALNNFNQSLSWEDAGFGELEDITDIRGIIMAGDITQNGRDGRIFSNNEYGEFVKRYGLCANKEVNYPMYEGYGNHDFFEWDNLFYRIPQDHPVADSVAIRNEYRPGLLNTAPDLDGHYSWEWDNIHFVQLNLAPSDSDPDLEINGLRDPRNALTFLKNNLDEYVVGTNKKVVLISHYGPWDTFEWDDTQIDELCGVIEAYNPYIMSYIHGHSHSTNVYDWCGISIFNSGTPYHEDYNEDFRGRFTLFRIVSMEDDKLKLVAADISWSSENYEEGNIASLDLQMKNWNGFPYEENITN